MNQFNPEGKELPDLEVCPKLAKNKCIALHYEALEALIAQDLKLAEQKLDEAEDIWLPYVAPDFQDCIARADFNIRELHLKKKKESAYDDE